ncbi:MAG: hypothetical protein FJ304_11690 [Planctomycetes bacterium]|nr:hypothetical protein [Planctomycetota bacterium]
MVMRNRGEGGGASHWWDDLPPQVRARFARAPEPEPAPPPAPSPRRELFADLTRLAVLFALVTGAILVYLLVVVGLVTG